MVKHLGADTIIGYMSALIHIKRRQHDGGSTDAAKKFYSEFNDGGSSNDTRTWFTGISKGIIRKAFKHLRDGDGETCKGALPLDFDEHLDMCTAWSKIGNAEVRLRTGRMLGGYNRVACKGTGGAPAW